MENTKMKDDVNSWEHFDGLNVQTRISSTDLNFQLLRYITDIVQSIRFFSSTLSDLVENNHNYNLQQLESLICDTGHQKKEKKGHQMAWKTLKRKNLARNSRYLIY